MATAKAGNGRQAKGDRADGIRKMKTPHPVDIYVGARIRYCRTLLGISQGDLAKATGLAPQQIHKNERAESRVSASRLLLISRALKVPIQFFFDELPDDLRKVGNPLAPEFSAPLPKLTKVDPLAQPETIELVHAFLRIFKPKERRFILDLTKSLADKTTE